MSKEPEMPGPVLRFMYFMRDWAFLAPLNLWLLLIVSAGYNLPLASEELAKGALLTFGIACIVAHYGDVGIKEWRPAHLPTQALKVVIYFAWWGGITLAFFTLSGVAIGAAMEAKAKSTAAPDGSIATFVEAIVQPISYFAVNVGWLVSIIGILTGTYAATRPREAGANL